MRRSKLSRGVYSVCMARVNVYLPDELAERAKLAGVSISTVTQHALRSALAAMDTNTWLDRLDQHAGADVEHEHVLAALDDAREDFGARSAR
jgi:post-segregation antitoxin (ccd killing protein)